MSKKPSYVQDFKSLTTPLMVSQLHFSEEEAETFINYRNQFGLFHGQDNQALVALDCLWKSLDFPRLSHGARDFINENNGLELLGQIPKKLKQILAEGFSEWMAQVVLPEAEEGGHSIEDIIIPTPGRGRNPTKHFVTVAFAKEVAMMSRTPAGRKARRYFVLVEEVLKRLVEYNGVRISTEKYAKHAAYETAKRVAGGSQEFGKVIGEMKHRFNSLVKEVAGERNAIGTDSILHNNIAFTTSRLMGKGLSDEEIKEFLN